MESNCSVKDKNNIFDVDLWSGSDYSKIVHTSYSGDITLAASGGVGNTLISSTDYSIKGDRSIKSTLNSNQYFEITLNSIDDSKTYAFSGNIYNPENSVTISLIAQDTTGTLSQKLESTTINSGSGADVTPVSLLISQISGYNRIKIRVMHNSSGSIYVDNLKVLLS